MRALIRASGKRAIIQRSSYYKSLLHPSFASRTGSLRLFESQQPMRKTSPPAYSTMSSSILGTQGVCSPETNLGLLRAHLTPSLLKDVRDLWFEPIKTDEHLILPQDEHYERWFAGSDELDRVCVQQFSPTLEAVRDSGVKSAADILSVVNPTSPFDWLGLILLLDQIPRNCYRGPASRTVFTFFDPLVQQIALQAVESGIPNETPELRWRLSYRPWLYLPFMHSEDMKLHDIAIRLYQEQLDDVQDLINSEDAATDDEYRKAARKVIKANAEEALELARTNAEYEKKHADLVRKFGRYPHRNEPLGRVMTAEEQEYLDQGGETFKANKED